jgi:protoheme IX farnesyltransferase
MHDTLIVLKNYYRLTKPGIIRGNVMTAIGGFLLASRGNIDWWLLVATCSGTALIIASACTYNNIIDQDIDAKMERTRKRALVVGDIADEAAWSFAAVLGLLGAFILFKFTNMPTLLLGVLGFITYVYVYTYAKRKTVHATLLGTIPGATAVTAGYTAANGGVDLGAVLLFVIMLLWQMPHFYSIAMFRLKDYKAAGIPVLPAVQGMQETKKQIVIYIAVYMAAAASLALYGYASFTYFVVMLYLSAWWLYKAFRGLRKGTEDIKWAKGMFGASLLVLLVWSVLLSLDTWLP